MNSFERRNAFKRIALTFLAVLILTLTVPHPTFAGEQSLGKQRRRADKALREGEFDVAAKMFREMLAKDVHDRQARLGLSFALLKQRLLRDSYDHAARVLMVDPLSARAHALLGASILAGGDFRESVEEFKTALSIQENEALAIAGLAMVDFYENRLDSAIRGLRRASEIDSSEPDYVFNLGQATARSERYKEAADSYERFLAIAPKTDADRRARIRGLIDFLRYLGRQSSLYVLSGKGRTDVPFESVDGRPVLKVRVNGNKEPLRFVLDTGSGMSVISETTAKKLGLNAVARGGLARAVGGGGKFEIVYGFLSSLELGEVKVESVPVYIRHFFDGATPVDGYLGLSVIARFIAALDYGTNTFSLRRNFEPAVVSPEASNVEGGLPSGIIEIPVRTTSSGFISGEVRVEGIEKPLNFIIDTGATISVVSERLTEQEDLASYMQPTRMRVFGAAGVSEDVKTVLLPRVMLGRVVRENINAAILDLEPLNETSGFSQTGILGANFLRHFRVSFDFQKGLIRLEPLRRANRTNTNSQEVIINPQQ
ncbi:MAG TPA: aspartyl protease family protein [Pyrinomonadaceae bacterium]|nr:aspartyl protease family protein [Pyrinomonadaceae bacterium]